MVRVLELFSGTGSVGKVCKARGYEVVSLDLILPADIKADILLWDYKKAYPVGHFDIIAASPVCLWWSNLRNSSLGKKIKNGGGAVYTKELFQHDIDTYGKPMVRKVLEIIQYFQPFYYWIENPQTGRMKDFLIKLPHYDVDYCKYSDWGYKKRTRFWTNITGFTPLTCKKDCGSIVEGTRHSKVLGNGYAKDENGKVILINTKARRTKYKKHRNEAQNSGGTNLGSTTKLDRYRIPPKLIEELLNCCIFI